MEPVVWILDPVRGKPTTELENDVLTFQWWVSLLKERTGTDEFGDLFKAIRAMRTFYWKQSIGLMRSEEMYKLQREYGRFLRARRERNEARLQEQRREKFAAMYLPLESKASKRFWRLYGEFELEVSQPKPDTAKLKQLREELNKLWLETKKMTGKMICGMHVLQTVDGLLRQEVPMQQQSTFRRSDIPVTSAA